MVYIRHNLKHLKSKAVSAPMSEPPSAAARILSKMGTRDTFMDWIMRSCEGKRYSAFIGYGKKVLQKMQKPLFACLLHDDLGLPKWRERKKQRKQTYLAPAGLQVPLRWPSRQAIARRRPSVPVTTGEKASNGTRVQLFDLWSEEKRKLHL